MHTSHSALSLVLVLLLTGQASSWCTEREMGMFVNCAWAYAWDFLVAFGLGGYCNRRGISWDICNKYANIVSCVNRQPVSRTTCRPYGVRQMNSRIPIPCKVEDFRASCPYAPQPDEGY